MKSTKVQTLGAVTLHATRACTDALLVKSTQLGCSVVSCLALHVVGLWTYACAHALASYTHALTLSHEL